MGLAIDLLVMCFQIGELLVLICVWVVKGVWKCLKLLVVGIVKFFALIAILISRGIERYKYWKMGREIKAQREAKQKEEAERQARIDEFCTTFERAMLAKGGDKDVVAMKIKQMRAGIKSVERREDGKLVVKLANPIKPSEVVERRLEQKQQEKENQDAATE